MTRYILGHKIPDFMEERPKMTKKELDKFNAKKQITEQELYDLSFDECMDIANQDDKND